jgi:predicted enzyme related to lactoylglutathione lyase
MIDLEQTRNFNMTIDGALDYVELPGSDMPATKAFYASVFGWSFADYGPDYVAFEIDGRTGGFNAARKVVPGGGPLVVIYANDLDAMEAKVRQAGAEILSREIFEGGRRFHFRDPNGNEIAVWTKS